MTLEIVPLDDPRSSAGIEITRIPAIPLTEEERQLRESPAHNRVTCSQCNRQLRLINAVRSDEGFICRTHVEE